MDVGPIDDTIDEEIISHFPEEKEEEPLYPSIVLVQDNNEGPWLAGNEIRIQVSNWDGSSIGSSSICTPVGRSPSLISLSSNSSVNENYLNSSDISKTRSLSDSKIDVPNLKLKWPSDHKLSSSFIDGDSNLKDKNLRLCSSQDNIITNSNEKMFIKGKNKHKNKLLNVFHHGRQRSKSGCIEEKKNYNKNSSSGGGKVKKILTRMRSQSHGDLKIPSTLSSNQKIDQSSVEMSDPPPNPLAINANLISFFKKHKEAESKKRRWSFGIFDQNTYNEPYIPTEPPVVNLFEENDWVYIPHQGESSDFVEEPPCNSENNKYLKPKIVRTRSNSDSGLALGGFTKKTKRNEPKFISRIREFPNNKKQKFKGSLPHIAHENEDLVDSPNLSDITNLDTNNRVRKISSTSTDRSRSFTNLTDLAIDDYYGDNGFEKVKSLDNLTDLKQDNHRVPSLSDRVNKGPKKKFIDNLVNVFR